MGTLIRMQKGMQCDLIGLGKETIAQLEEFKTLLALSKRLYASANEYAAKMFANFLDFNFESLSFR